MATKLNIVNFGLFVKAITGLSGAVEGIKLSVGKEQTKILSRNPVTRIKLTTNSLTSDDPVEFCIKDLPAFVKVLKMATAKLDEDDKITFEVKNGFLHIKSKPFKSKFALCKEDVIISWLDKEVTTSMDETSRIRTTVDNIKELERSAFIFNDPTISRIYLFADDTNKGLLKAELNDRKNPYSNAITVNFGQILSGTFADEIIINYDRIKMFTLFEGVDEIEIVKPNIAALSCQQKIEDGDEFLKSWILVSIMKD